MISSLLGVLLVLAWWYLIALLVQDEALPGDRQFWLTRPYVRRDLIAAKLLFLLSFISVPWLLADCAILAAQNLPVAVNFPAILLRQVACLTLFILPALLIAMVTSGVKQFLLAFFIAALGFVGLSLLLNSHSGNVVIGSQNVRWTAEWIERIVILVLAVSFVIWLYSSRRTTAGRIVLGAVGAWFLLGPGVGNMPNWKVVNSRTPREIDTSGIGVSSRAQDETRSYSGGSAYGQAEYFLVDVPIRVTGLPPNVELGGYSGGMTYQLSSGDGAIKELTHTASEIKAVNGDYLQVINMPVRQWESLKMQRLTLRTSFQLTPFTVSVATRIPATYKRATRIADVGDCKVDRASFGLSCKAGVWQPQRFRIQLRGETTDTGVNFESPYPLIVGLSPVQKWVAPFTALSQSEVAGMLAQPRAVIEVSPERPLGEFRRTLVLPNVRLGDYAPGARNP
ncbi:MAG TPA: hypothetical protein VHZ55_01865 [Bryobacteraceae bacterium]|nr:hypothetical protein [Bryobacteraceae bacterium]